MDEAVTAGRTLSRGFFDHDPVGVAPRLLGKVLVSRLDGAMRAGRIVEVEAYRGADDPASHTHRGPTARNATMFGPPGHLYVYFTYGMHHCANLVCSEAGEGNGVLLRALAPLAGLPAMFEARGGHVRRERDLCSGPGNLARALGLARTQDGLDVCTRGGLVEVLDDGTPPPAEPTVTARVGLRVGVERPWRFYVPGDSHVSSPRVPRYRLPG